MRSVGFASFYYPKRRQNARFTTSLENTISVSAKALERFCGNIPNFAQAKNSAVWATAKKMRKAFLCSITRDTSRPLLHFWVGTVLLVNPSLSIGSRVSCQGAALRSLPGRSPELPAPHGCAHQVAEPWFDTQVLSSKNEKAPLYGDAP